VAVTNENIDARFASLDYEAPFLIEKLLKEQIADSPSEAQALFTEVKRYILLAQLDDKTPWKMHSLRVDEAWHQFVLFTQEYIQYCERFFNHYVQHNPGNAPNTNRDVENSSSFEAFRNHYEAFFKIPLPDVWCDEKSVTPRRRIVNYEVGKLIVHVNRGMVDLVDAKGNVLLSVSDFVKDALEFIVRTGAFYVRELPGNLPEEEKVGLIATLVEYNLLRVAS
jgi:hypothetical protein